MTATTPLCPCPGGSRTDDGRWKCSTCGRLFDSYEAWGAETDNGDAVAAVKASIATDIAGMREGNPVTASYGWIIDTDELAEPGSTPGTNMNAVGVRGPRDIPDAIEARLVAGEGRKFRMYDDDGEYYYSGRIISSEVGKGREIGEEGFAPLDDYGRGNAGATDIRYYIDNRWETL